MNQHQVIPLFSQCLYVSGGEKYKLKDREDEFIKKCPYRENLNNLISLSNNILEEESMSEIKEYILSHVENYTRDILKISRHIEFKIVSSWINLTTKGRHHHQHVHGNSVISGIFNVSSNNKVMFGDMLGKPFAAWTMDVEEQNLFNSDSWSVVSEEPGNVILFPSTLMHGVPTHKGDDVRTTISFNLMPQGFIAKDTTDQLNMKML